MKGDREELENKAKEITKPNSKTSGRKKKGGRKNVKRERKIRNRNSWTLSWITKTKIGGSREIRSNVERGKREIGKGKWAGSPLLAKVYKGKNFEWWKGSRWQRNRRHKIEKEGKKERRGAWRGIRSGALTRPETFVAKTVDSGAAVCSRPIKSWTLLPLHVSDACTCSFKYVWGRTEDYLRAIASLAAI